MECLGEAGENHFSYYTFCEVEDSRTDGLAMTPKETDSTSLLYDQENILPRTKRPLGSPILYSCSTSAPLSDRGTSELLVPLLPPAGSGWTRTQWMEDTQIVSVFTNDGYCPCPSPRSMLVSPRISSHAITERATYRLHLIKKWLRSKIEWNVIARIIFFISLWYFSSISLTLFNKLIWTEIPDARDNTASLIALQSLVMSFGIFIVYLMGKIDLSFANIHNVVIAFLPMACLSSVDIACTNSAYSYVDVSVVVVIKSSIPCITYLCGVLFGINAFSWLKVVVLIWIALTVSLTINEMKLDETNYVGITLSVCAVVASALRWTMTQIFIKGKPCRIKVINTGISCQIDPVQMVAVMQPLILVSLLPVVVYHDKIVHKLFSRPSAVITSSPSVRRLTSGKSVGTGYDLRSNEIQALIIYSLVSSVLAYAVTASEMFIIKYTDSTTLTVGGIGKEIFVILLASLCFGEVIESRTAIAIGLTIAGIFCYAMIDWKCKRVMSEDVNETERSLSHVILETDSSPAGIISVELEKQREGLEVIA